jgi:hypothetical protein
MAARRRVTSTIRDNRIDFEIPMMTDQDIDCQICREKFCGEGMCGKSLVHLKCCTSPICAKCAFKQAKRCTCKSNCEQVCIWCPFCRSFSPLSALDIWLGALRTRKCEYCPEEEEEVDGEEDEDDDTSYVPEGDEDDEDDEDGE